MKDTKDQNLKKCLNKSMIAVSFVIVSQSRYGRSFLQFVAVIGVWIYEYSSEGKWVNVSVCLTGYCAVSCVFSALEKKCMFYKAWISFAGTIKGCSSHLLN